MSSDRPLPGHSVIRQVNLWLDYQSGSWFHVGDQDPTVEQVMELYRIVKEEQGWDLIENAWEAGDENTKASILQTLNINPESQTARNIRKYNIPYLSE